MTFKHQGDILFTPFNGEIKGKKVKHNGSIVLALGEKTGHKHVIETINHDDMEAWRTIDGEFVITLKTEAQVHHNQHGTITLPAGTYVTGKEREYDWFSEAVRQVID
jgi:hypothetical protein